MSWLGWMFAALLIAWMIGKGASGGKTNNSVRQTSTHGEGSDPHLSHDPLFEDALFFVCRNNDTSISSLQRHFHISFLRAERLMKEIVDSGIIIGDWQPGTEEIRERREEWKSTLETLWEGKENIQFAYKWGEKREWRNVDLEKIVGSSGGNLYLHGFCRTRNEPRHFRFDRISSQIKAPDNSQALYFTPVEYAEMLIAGVVPERGAIEEENREEAWDDDPQGFLESLLGHEIPMPITCTRRSKYDVFHIDGKPRQWIARMYSYEAYGREKIWMQTHGEEKILFFSDEGLSEKARAAILRRMADIQQPRIT